MPDDILRDLRKRVSRIMSEGPRPVAPAVPEAMPEPEAAEDAWCAPVLFPRGEGETHEELLGGAEVIHDAETDSRCWQIDLPVGPDWPEAAARCARLAEALTADPDEAPEHYRAAYSAGAEGLLFLDIETCGLAGEPVFLVGCMVLAAGGPLLRFFLARDFPEEPALLALLNEWWRDFACVVTFNGNSFDLPFLRHRMRLHGVRPSPPPERLDLLHTSRRRWKGDLPNCRLQTLERAILGRARHDDLPSAEVPRVFAEYAVSGDARLVVPILQHNALDLVSLAELLLRQVEDR